MSFRLRHLLIRHVLPLTTRNSARQKTRVLQEFAQTELDSAWQSVYALPKVQDTDTRLLLFDHAVEELFHADLFSRLAAEKSPDLPGQLITRREPLIALDGKDQGRVVEFLAYLSTGETEINTDFEVYETAIPDKDIRRVIKTIREDEVWHAKDSTEQLEKMAAVEGKKLSWLRFRHLLFLAQRRYASVMGKFGTLPMTLMMFVAYALFGGIFASQARRRLSMGSGEQLGFMRRQQESFRAKLGASR